MADADGRLAIFAIVVHEGQSLKPLGTGFSFQEFGFNASCPAESGNWCVKAHNETNLAVRVGYTVGGGVEKSFGFSSAGLSNDCPWLARIEYRFADYGGLTHDFFSNTVDVIGVKFPLQTNTIQVGLGYRF